METLLTNIFTASFDWITHYFERTPYALLAYDFFVLYVVFEIIMMLLLILRMKVVTHRNMRLSRPHSGGKKILVAGDSSAVGTGAMKPEDTISGRLAQDFPEADVLNLAVNGSLTRDVIRQLQSVSGTTFDMIIISTGGNDVWHLSSLGRLAQDLARALQLAKQMSSGKVIVLFFGNEGSAPFFPSVVRKFLLKRTFLIKEVFEAVTAQENVNLIQLFDSESSRENPFVANPKENFAIDGLHPSSAGYWLWYKRMWYLIVSKKYI